MNQDCPLCGTASGFFAKEGPRSFFRCPECELIHVLASERLDLQSETKRYELHQNNSSDQGYRTFLDQLLIPLAKVLKPGARGLDYGCGPGPTISVMLAERGFLMTNYDPIFFKDETALSTDYDFITCTEAAEHFFDPAREFKQLDKLLRPGGKIGMMTSTYHDEQSFEKWHYAKDPTHVSFYSRKTIDKIARRQGWACSMERDNVILFHKPQ